MWSQVKLLYKTCLIKLRIILLEHYLISYTAFVLDKLFKIMGHPQWESKRPKDDGQRFSQHDWLAPNPSPNPMYFIILCELCLHMRFIFCPHCGVVSEVIQGGFKHGLLAVCIATVAKNNSLFELDSIMDSGST